MLDMIESDYGFSEKYDTYDQNRRCAPTAYALARNIYYISSYKTKDGEAVCCWWLRSPGGRAYYAAYVTYYGSVYTFGDYVNCDHNDYNGVRPALYINLK